jgi:hypothetical protein
MSKRMPEGPAFFQALTRLTTVNWGGTLPFLCEKYGVREFTDGSRLLAEGIAYYNDERVHLETGEIPTRRWEAAMAAEHGRLRPPPADADRTLHRHRVQLRWISEERFWVLQGSHKVGDFLLSGDALQP